MEITYLSWYSLMYIKLDWGLKNAQFILLDSKQIDELPDPKSIPVRNPQGQYLNLPEKKVIPKYTIVLILPAKLFLSTKKPKRPSNY